MDATEYRRYSVASALLHALAAPLRLAIVIELASGGVRCVHELVDSLGVTQPLVSQHLRILRSAGVVRGARRGREIEYALADDHVSRIVADAIVHANEGAATASSASTNAYADTDDGGDEGGDHAPA
jgi:DNA-binding transcriptional ArsR family regulator